MYYQHVIQERNNYNIVTKYIDKLRYNNGDTIA